MARLLTLVAALSCGCGSSSSASLDADPGVGDPDAGGDEPRPDGSVTAARTITLTLPNRPNNAAAFSFLVAYQEGSAPWRLAPAPNGDTYTFEITAPSYGVAFTCISNTAGTGTSPLRSVTTAYFAVAERTSVTLEVPPRCTDRNPMTVTLSGTVTNRPIGGVLAVQYGTRTAIVSQQSGAFTLQTPPGTRDLVVLHAVPEGNGEYYTDSALVVRDVAVTAATTRTIDFSAAADTVSYEVNANVSNARIVASTTLRTANGTSVMTVRESFDWESDALATAQRRSSDIYEQSIVVTTPGRGVTVTNATSTPGTQTYVAPAQLGTVTSTVPTKQPYVTIESSWPAYANGVGYVWSATQQATCSGNVSCLRVWTANLSPGVTGASPAYRMPDLSALAGWKADFQLVSGSPIAGSVTAVTSTAGAADFLTGPPADGTKRAFVRTDYGITP